MREKIKKSLAIFLAAIVLMSGIAVTPVSAATVYVWNKYNVVTTTTYSQGTWSAWSATTTTTSSFTGSSSYTFSSTTGFVLSGSKTISKTSPGTIYTGSASSITETNITSTGAKKTRTCSRITGTSTYSKGTYVGQVFSESSTAYPNNGKNGSYWYVHSNSVAQVFPTVTISTITNKTLGQSVTVNATSSTPCYRMSAKYTINGVDTWLGDVYSSSYSKTFTPTTAGTYTVTVYSRSYVETDPKSAASSSSKSFTVSQPVTYTVTYNSNGNTGGTAPASQTWTSGNTLTLRTNTGNLTKTGYTFGGWNTNSAGTGTAYSAGQSGVNLGSSNVTLYAKWVGLPTVSLNTPSANTSEQFRENHSISVSASGTNCSKIEVYVNNSLAYTSNSNSLSYSYPVNNTGTYNVYVKGYNSLGSTVSSLTRTVTVIPATSITITGTLVANIPQNGTGSSPTYTQLSNFKVKVVDQDLAFHDTWETTTTSSGYFSINVPNDTLENGLDLYIELVFENDAVKVVDNSDNVYKWTSTLNSDYNKTTLNLGVITFNESTHLNTVAAYNIYKVINQGHKYVKDETNVNLPKVTAKWWATNADASNLSGTLISINGTNGRHFMPYIILHEFGHYVMKSANAMPSGSGGTHSFNSPFSKQGAYSEGWAHYFPSAVLGVSNLQAGSTSYNIENGSYALQAAYSDNVSVEANAALVLRDLYDSSVDTMAPSAWDDLYSSSYLTIYNNMKSKVHNSMWDFYDTVISSASSNKLNIWKIFNSRALSYDKPDLSRILCKV